MLVLARFKTHLCRAPSLDGCAGFVRMSLANMKLEGSSALLFRPQKFETNPVWGGRNPCTVGENTPVPTTPKKPSGLDPPSHFVIALLVYVWAGTLNVMAFSHRIDNGPLKGSGLHE